jgi:hypothetical protein
MANLPDPRRPALQCILDAASSAIALAFRDTGELVEIQPIVAAIHKEHPDFRQSEIKVHVVWDVLVRGGKVIEAKPDQDAHAVPEGSAKSGWTVLKSLSQWHS